MDAEITASYQLVNGLLGVIEKSDTQLTANFSRHACSALLSKPLLMASGVASNQQQQVLLANACSRLLDGTTKLVKKGSLTDQAMALQVLAACIHACDVVNLLERAGGWSTMLTEALKRANAASEPAASPAAEQVTGASCTAAAVLFDRLQHHIELPGVRREVTSIVSKLLPQLLVALQNLRSSCSCHTSCLQLLAALLRCVPTALRSVATACEKTLQQLVVHVASSVSTSAASAAAAENQQVLAEAAQCIALLPAAPGDAATWSDTACRLLSSSHDVLDYLLMGLEGRPLDAQFRAYLTAATADGQRQQQGAAAASWLPSLPWRQEQLQGAGRGHMHSARLLLGVAISALQQLLQQPFAAPAPLPGYSLMLLAARLLLFDAAAAVAAGAVAASSTMYQELSVLQPQLQQAGWRLLQVVVASAGPQLQLQGVMLRLVRQGLRSIQVSGYAALQQQPVAVRCCVYSTSASVLKATGLAGVRGLAREAVGCAVLELYGREAAAKVAHKDTGSSKAGGQRPTKRVKTSGAAGGDLEQFDPVASAAAAAAAAGSDVSRLAAGADLQAQAAALHMLQQMLESGGQLLPAEVRAHVDAIAFHMAQTAAAAALRLQQQPAVCSVTSRYLGTWQAAAYQTLLASILVPSSSRPPFLSQALLLFREGRHSSNPLVAAVCQAASLQCEALLHPRAAAISSVKQYSGMETVQPLSKPVMWNAFDSVTQTGATAVAVADNKAPTAPAADFGVVAPAVSQQQQPCQQETPQQRVSKGTTCDGVVVMGYPVNMGDQQHQQQVPAQQQTLPPSKLERATATDAAVPNANALHNGVGAAMPSAPTRVEAAKQQQQHAVVVMEVDPHAALISAAAIEAAVESGSGAAAVQPAAGSQTTVLPDKAAAAGQVGWQHHAAATAFNDESSDSEGPLPDIDSGSDSEDEESA